MTSSTPDQPRDQPVDVDPLRARELADAGALLLDVREDDEWVLGHIPGATHVRLGDLEPAALPEGPVVALCRSGHRSGKAARVLAGAGLDHVYNLAGGMRAWHAAGLDVVGADGAPGTVD